MHISDLMNKIAAMNIMDFANTTNILNQSWPILVYLLIAVIVTQIPYLRVYFSLCNRLLHEVVRVMFGKGITKKIYLHNNKLGQATNMEQSQFKSALLTYAGYTGESLAAIGLFYLLQTNHYQWILYLFMGLIIVSLLFWIRHFSGILWGLSFVVLLALPINFHYPTAIIHLSSFLSSFILIQSIINGIHVCRQSLLERKNPEMNGFISRLKRIPVFIFGVFLLGQSLYTGYFIVKNILRIY